MRLSKATVTNAKAEGKTAFFWDDEIAGFGLVVQPSGSKSYCYQYRTAEGRTRRGTLGKPSETFTPTRAREKAKGWRRVIEDGGDPLEDKREARQALTMAELFDKYLESPRFSEKADSTRAVDRGRITRHLVPTLGREFVHKVSTDTARRAFAKIRDGKTAANVKTDNKRGRAIVKGGEGTARSAIRLLRAVFTWAVEEGYATSNPATGVKVGTDGERELILSSPEEYRRLFRTLDDLEARHAIRQPVADAIRVIALTGARRGEIAGLEWAHVDLERGRLVLPAARHKTGGKTGKPRIIGLPTAAQAIIARQPEGEPDAFVFRPARSTGGPLNLSKAWRRVRADAELPEGIGLHGLRHSLASSMAMAGAQAAEIMVTLGHRQLSTTQRYIHAAQDARAALAERAAATVTAALDDDDAADVVKIR